MVKKENSSTYKRLIKIVEIPSMSPSSEEENRVAQELYDEISQEKYFKSHPEDLRLLPVEGDGLDRHIVFAIVRASKKTDKTVLMMGHMDVVAVDVFGPLKDLAFDPESYTEKLDPKGLGEDAAKDLRSGEWLFGRGVADMKSGVCAGTELLMELSKKTEDLKSNVAVLFVPDEENNSAGMLGAARWLARFQEEGLSFLCCVDLEPTFATGEDAQPTVYLGSLGKINPFIYCLGKEAHAGEYYDGFSVGPTISRIGLSLDGDISLSDRLGNNVYPPFAALKIEDMRDEYSATILSRSAMAFSYLTSTKMPGEIIELLKDTALKALNDSITEHEERKATYRRENGMAAPQERLKARVFTVGEIMSLAEKKTGRSGEDIAFEIIADCPKKDDERAKGLKVISQVVDDLGLRGPLAVVGFLPPWYPHRVNEERLPQDELPRKAAKELVLESLRQGVKLEVRTMFEGVSDLSYCGFTGDRSDAIAFEENMPGGKTLYDFPTEELLKLSIPVLNFGPVGKDAHKETERLHLPFYLDSYPKLLRHLIETLGK
ncbi:M20/M25/M40 family metallo-hydrolase [Dethiosulfovibrio sp. F2B]|uniref:M20/M25/M40 family metallo-hydrolase n=1 Tax=Dethiosulfovibrio faecalis TaxID=2720018 RepID=UPI001F332ACF|nr:M20/M25/M40 family metallo-hydrolase [Dethiosulfovibrio faecalis]MCF4151221.1 M20/M25/M40 family metallo-hydrolase [Dethiosulfovibrio faecalis]